MSRQNTRDLSVSDVDIGMMILRVRSFGDAIHESDAVGERSEGIRLCKSVTATCPAGELTEGTLNLEIREFGTHGANQS